MSVLLRNILAVVCGMVIGSAANMALVWLGPLLVAAPTGVDMASAEGLAAGMARLQPVHFLFPFLAHALGTFTGALVAYAVAGSHKPRFAWAIGVFFLLGGIAASTMIPAPLWFKVLDLVGAYLPMAWLAVRVGGRWWGDERAGAVAG
jgi:hypothetical protein